MYAGTSAAPPTRRTAHRTRMHAGPSHAPHRAEHGVFFRVQIARVQLERRPPQGDLAIGATHTPTRKKESYSKADEKLTLSAAQGASKV